MVEDSRTFVRSLSRRIACRLAALVLFVAGQSAGRLRAEDGERPPLPPRALIRIGTNDLRTRDEITDVAFSPDGRFIAAAEGGANPSSKVSLFDVRTGRQVVRMTLTEPDAVSVSCLAFSPDGATLAWGEREGHVVLWDVHFNRLIRRARLHDRTVSSVAFSPDGRRIASGDVDGVVRLRQFQRPEDIARRSHKNAARPDPRLVEQTLRNPDTAIRGLAFTPDGTRLVAGTTMDDILVWRLSDGELLRRISWSQGMRGAPPTTPSLQMVAVAPDGRRIFASGYRHIPIEQTRLSFPYRQVPIGQVRSWDVETGERLLDVSNDSEPGFGYGALSPDGRHAALSASGSIRDPRRRDGPARAEDRAAGRCGASTGLLTRRGRRRRTGRECRPCVRGLHRPAPAPGRAGAGRLRPIRRVVPVGRSDRHSTWRRLRASLGRGVWSADLATARDSAHRRDRAKR